jgi:hypothetical protein
MGGPPAGFMAVASCKHRDTARIDLLEEMSMAKVRLSRYEVEDRGLPGVCMQCGAQAWSQKAKTFSWCPPWTGVLILAGLLPYVIVVAILTKRMTVHAPLCDEHKNHWAWRNWVLWLGLVILAVLGIASLVLLATQQDRRGGSNPIAGLACAGTAVAFLIWLITVAIIQQGAIRPTEITDDEITLTNVSAGFVDALEKEQNKRAPEYEDRWRRPRRGDDDDRYRPPRRSDDDRFRESDNR